MDSPAPPPDVQNRWLRPSDQRVIAAAAWVALVALSLLWLLRQCGEGRIDIDEAEPLNFRFEVDLNTAGLQELCQLPDIGPTLAGRIIDWRSQHGPFKALDEIAEVPGIGPRKLEKLRLHLKPLPTTAGEP